MEKDNKEREKLIELIKVMECHPEKTCPEDRTTCKECKNSEGGGLCNVFARKADYLLRNNVFVPPCKVGDKVYFIIEDANESYILEQRINDVSTKGFFVSSSTLEENCDDFEPYSNLGKNMFLAKEEAEQALVNYKSSKNDELRKEDVLNG